MKKCGDPVKGCGYRHCIVQENVVNNELNFKQITA